MTILLLITAYLVLSSLVTPLIGAYIRFGVRDEPAASELQRPPAGRKARRSQVKLRTAP
jgi:hypothetical protein